MEYKNKEKLKEQNSSTITEPKNGQTVTKGLGRMGGRRRVRAGKKEGDLTISMHNVLGGAWGGLCNTEKTSSD